MNWIEKRGQWVNGLKGIMLPTVFIVRLHSMINFKAISEPNLRLEIAKRWVYPWTILLQVREVDIQNGDCIFID